MRIAGVLFSVCLSCGASAASAEDDAAQQAQRRLQAIRAQCSKLPQQVQATTAQEVYLRALCQQPLRDTQPPAEDKLEKSTPQQSPSTASEPESLVVDASTDLSELPLGYHCHPFAFGKKVCHTGPQ